MLPEMEGGKEKSSRWRNMKKWQKRIRGYRSEGKYKKRKSFDNYIRREILKEFNFKIKIITK
jgi:hypothetical protein